MTDLELQEYIDKNNSEFVTWESPHRIFRYLDQSMDSPNEFMTGMLQYLRENMYSKVDIHKVMGEEILEHLVEENT